MAKTGNKHQAMTGLTPFREFRHTPGREYLPELLFYRQGIPVVLNTIPCNTPAGTECRSGQRMTQRGVIASAHWMREARAPRSKASTGVCSRAHGTRAIMIPLPPVRVPCVCSRAHGKQAAPIICKLSRNKAFFRPVFGTATPSRDTSETSPRGEEGFYRHFGTATLN